MQSIDAIEQPAATGTAQRDWPVGASTRVWSTRLGMPHLATTGLCEAWLLKECGHVHWGLLEEAVQAPSRLWKDVSGARLYASFVAYQLEGDVLSQVQEGDLFRVRSRLAAFGANRWFSRHELQARGCEAIGTLWMVSSFVRRVDGSNHGFVRAAFGGAAQPLTDERSRLAVEQLLVRRRELRRDAELFLARQAESGPRFRVCPMEDYNAAGMVYFASFPRFLDRAEAALRGTAYQRPLGALSSRSCFYFGNADSGVELSTAASVMGAFSCTQVWFGATLLCAAETLRMQ